MFNNNKLKLYEFTAYMEILVHVMYRESRESAAYRESPGQTGALSRSVLRWTGWVPIFG